MTSRRAEAASRKHVKKANAMETAALPQNTFKGLQKLGSGACRIPVRFRLVTPDDADPALIIAYAKACHQAHVKYR